MAESLMKMFYGICLVQVAADLSERQLGLREEQVAAC